MTNNQVRIAYLLNSAESKFLDIRPKNSGATPPGLTSIKTFCGACLLNQHFSKTESYITEYPKLY